MAFQQEVTIANCQWSSHMSCMCYDVVIEKNGSLKWSDGDRQVVRGILRNGKFKFIIPLAAIPLRLFSNFS